MSKSNRAFQSEDALTGWLREKAPRIGDDAALLPALGDHAITVDSQRQGVHFVEGTSAGIIARRLLAVNLSDLAAVGASPYQVLCTLASPTNFDRREFFESLLAACDDYSVELIGGDLSAALTVECTLTAIGKRPPRGRFLERTTAEPEQSLWLAGRLGESALGRHLLAVATKRSNSGADLGYRFPKTVQTGHRQYAEDCIRRHLAPEPQLAMAAFLSTRRSAVAAIDISDGLAKDLGRLAAASDCGIELEFAAVSKSCNVKSFAALCASLRMHPQELLFAGGEDYALAFTADSGLDRKIANFGATNGIQVERIGAVTDSKLVTMDFGSGPVPLASYLRKKFGRNAGWDHLRRTED